MGSRREPVGSWLGLRARLATIFYDNNYYFLLETFGFYMTIIHRQSKAADQDEGSKQPLNFSTRGAVDPRRNHALQIPLSGYHPNNFQVLTNKLKVISIETDLGKFNVKDDSRHQRSLR